MRVIKNWVVATFILSFLVIIAGAVVRTTQSGMGCPDWPRCFGKWIPPTNASELPGDFEKYLRRQDIDHTFNVWHTWIEYFNRLLGALLGLFAIIQVIVLISRRDTRRTSWKLALSFLIIVILTGLFGAVVVKLNLAHLSISIHLFFALVLIQVQLALLLSIKSKLFIGSVDRGLKNLLAFLLVMIILQSSLGTMVRIHVDDISKILHYEQRETWLANSPLSFLVHRTFSWVVLATALYLAWVGKKNEFIKKKLFALAGILLLSMITGITLFYADVPAFAQPIHLLLATMAITQIFSILLQVKWTSSLIKR